jgi:hypothetical protein
VCQSSLLWDAFFCDLHIPVFPVIFKTLLFTRRNGGPRPRWSLGLKRVQSGPLQHWDHVFQSRLGQTDMSTSSVFGGGSSWDRPLNWSKEPYQMPSRFIVPDAIQTKNVSKKVIS